MKKLYAVFFCAAAGVLVAFAAWANPPPVDRQTEPAVFANVTAHGPTAMAQAPGLVPTTAAIVISPGIPQPILALHWPNGEGSQPQGGDRDALVATLPELAASWEKSIVGPPALALIGTEGGLSRGILAAGT